MPMPTTRKGRFEYFKARQRRRLARARFRRAHDSSNLMFGFGGHHMSSREPDISSFTKQEPREYPRVQVNVAYYYVAPSPWRVEPTRGVFGVPEWVPVTAGFPPPGYHVSKPFLGYVSKRLKSIPRLKHIPRKPWKFTKGEILPGDFYPYDVYPSGQPSHRSTLPG